METSQPRYSREEFARRGDDIYDRVVAPRLEEDDLGKFVLMDIDSEDYEIAASDRLLARKPGARVWFTRTGSRYARRFGELRRWLPPA